MFYLFTMNLSNILVWNARCLNNKARRDYVRDTILSSKADIICLQETKMASLSTHLLLSVCGSDFDKFLTLPANGTRGGILIAWKGAVCQVISSRIDNFSVSVQFAGMDGNWWFTGVYGSQEDESKIQFLRELLDFRALSSEPWLLAGDFNMVYQAAGKVIQGMVREEADLSLGQVHQVKAQLDLATSGQQL
jgi:exonuclease III